MRPACSQGVTFRPLPYFVHEPIPKQQTLKSSKLKEFAEDEFKTDENGEGLSERTKTLWKMEKLFVTSIFSFFHSVFQTCTADT